MEDFVVFSAAAFNDKTSRWDVDEKNSMGEIKKTHDFASKKQADAFIKAEILKNSPKGQAGKAMKENKTTKEMMTSNMLTSALDGLGTLPMSHDEGNADVRELLAARKLEILENWDSKKKAFTEQSKHMIAEIANLYFDAKIIKKNQLIAYKKEMEEADISSLLMQHDIAEQAVYRLHEQIEMGAAVPRTFEVLAGMQKFVLELLVSKRKFMKEMEEDLRALNDEIMMKESTDLTISDSSNTGKLTSNSQKTLIQNLHVHVEMARKEMDSYLNIPSKNVKLRKETDVDSPPAITDIDHVEVETPFLKTSKGGLSSFDDEE